MSQIGTHHWIMEVESSGNTWLQPDGDQTVHDGNGHGDENRGSVLLSFRRSRIFFLIALPLLISCSAPPAASPRRLKAAVPGSMVSIPAGTYRLGSEVGLPDEKPVHEVHLDEFWIDRTEVTNRQFAEFVAATGYVTTAEKSPDPKDFPGADPEMLKPGSLVFEQGKDWWYCLGASWRHPQGPGSDIKGKDDHPVVQVSWDDAMAYAKWTGKTLPTEAQWEAAARGGLMGKPFVWGEAPLDKNKPQANVWQGDFPQKNLNTDGFLHTAPVGSFPANGYGLKDTAGNVWEWCLDWYRPDAYLSASAKNPAGPLDSVDPDEPGVSKRVIRGGSFLCADCYCKGYRPSARMKSSPDTGLMHTGFRCVVNLN